MPTRIAIIADIHGNPPALEAVVADVEAQGVREVLVAGDLVGRGPRGGEVVTRIADLGWPTIRGNHEDYLLSFRRGTIPDAWRGAQEWAASRWMAAELDDAHIDFIDALPLTMASAHAPPLRIVHGSPRGYNDGIGTWTTDAQLQAHLDAVEEDVLVCAHTHRPMIREAARGLVVNVGSVGLPFNGDVRAQYAIFTLDEGRWSAELRQVAYDREAFLASYQSTGFLAEGAITALLLEREVRFARPYLVPFLAWAGALGVEPVAEALPDFDSLYQPGMATSVFFGLLDGLGS